MKSGATIGGAMNARGEALASTPARRGLLVRNRWLLARRGVQLGILGLFLAGPWLGIWWLKGNLASSTFLDVIGLTDPLVLLQSFVAGHQVAARARALGAVQEQRPPLLGVADQARRHLDALHGRVGTDVVVGVGAEASEVARCPAPVAHGHAPAVRLGADVAARLGDRA